MGWASHNDGGFHKMASVCPGGVNHNTFIVMVCPPGAYLVGLIITHLSLWYAPRGIPGGVNENFSPASTVHTLL